MARSANSMRALAACLLAAGLALAETNLAQRAAPASPASTSGNEAASGKATLLFLAVGHDGHPVTSLRAAELSLRIDDEPQKILSLAPANSEPRTIGIFFDTSGSRHSDKLIVNEAQATATFLQFIWHAGDDGFVVAFNRAPYALAEPTPDLQKIRSALQAVPSEIDSGGTALFDALCSVRFRPQTEDREKVFVMVSDFEDNESHISEEKTIRTMHDDGIRIFVLLRPLDANRHPETALHDKARAKEVAGQTGGDVFVVTNQTDLDAAFQRLGNELQGSYRLIYEPVPSAGTPKKQELKTTRPDLDLLYATN
jgi:VWFA-related protein